MNWAFKRNCSLFVLDFWANTWDNINSKLVRFRVVLAGREATHFQALVSRIRDVFPPPTILVSEMPQSVVFQKIEWQPRGQAKLLTV